MDEKQILFEQYRLAVEMADKVSSRREGANKIFLAANSAILAFLSTQQVFTTEHIFIALLGVLLCLAWASVLKNYRSLNSAKFAVIHEMEEQLPWKVYKDEWVKLKNGKDKRVYGKLSVVEKRLAWIFLGFTHHGRLY